MQSVFFLQACVLRKKFFLQLWVWERNSFCKCGTCIGNSSCKDVNYNSKSSCKYVSCKGNSFCEYVNWERNSSCTCVTWELFLLVLWLAKGILREVCACQSLGVLLHKRLDHSRHPGLHFPFSSAERDDDEGVSEEVPFVCCALRSSRRGQSAIRWSADLQWWQRFGCGPRVHLAAMWLANSPQL